MDLVIQLYLYSWQTEQDPFRKQAKQVRQMEIAECFLRNLHHPLVQTLHVLCDSEEAVTFYSALAKENNLLDKCVFVVHGKQPTYADFLRYVNKTIPDNHIVCIQNSDIYIDHGVSKEFLEQTVDTKHLIALTRHEHTNESHTECSVKTCPLIWDYMGSHDTFLFRTPLPSLFSIASLHYHQNVYGGETLFMKAFRDAGLTLVNPCFDIRIFHRHFQRISFSAYPTIADGHLCHVNPKAPQGREDIQSGLRTLFKD